MATLLLPAFCDHLRRQADVLCDLSLITGTYGHILTIDAFCPELLPGKKSLCINCRLQIVFHLTGSFEKQIAEESSGETHTDHREGGRQLS